MKKKMENEMETGIIRGIIGFRDFPKLGVPFKGGSILGLYRDNGKENGNYYLGFRVLRISHNLVYFGGSLS